MTRVIVETAKPFGSSVHDHISSANEADASLRALRLV
jgi:hypothetical protein